MAETYSLSITARHASSPTAAKTVKVPDSAAQPAHIQYHALRGDQILCQNPDGSMSYYTFDAERSTPNDIIMRRV
jgi:hypothetical protein